MGMPPLLLSCRTNGVGGGENGGLSFSLNDSTDRYAIGFVPPVAFTLAKVALLVSSKTGTPVAYNVRIETDNGSGRPSGTLAWTDATAQIAANQAAGWTSELTLTASGAVSPGTLYHVHIAPDTDPANANYINIQHGNHSGGAGKGPFAAYTEVSTNSGSSWAVGNGGTPYLVLVDSNGEKYGQVSGPGGQLSPTNTAWKGCKFTAPANMTVFAAVSQKLNSTSAGDVSAKLIDDTNTVIGTATLPAGYFDVQTARDVDVFPFSSPVRLTKGRVYRCVWKDTGSAHRIETIGTVAGGGTYKALLPGGGQFIVTEGTSSDGTASPTSWTDTDTQELCSFWLMAQASEPVAASRNIRIGGGC